MEECHLRKRVFAALALGFIAAILSRAASAQTGSRTESRVVPAGENRQLAFFTSLNPDCTVDGDMTVRIAKQASHGSVEIDRGLGYTAFQRHEQRYDCNRIPVEGYRVTYKPAAGYTGDDQFEVEFFSPQGRYSFWKYDVTVR